eukprot:CAMPEP_0114241070 /NCGR_PEP_ID=MMETSP0058-20121206/9441_1 /TAXON_ID=36894 /ORGANISM="Pyramimonas parkeae, CCMP726" /LENGTH=288 /DNA_ID=CAMNT_0001353581 /DNA_START=583 /DNA_END=1449 /DNA_ORIENTATION=+
MGDQHEFLIPGVYIEDTDCYNVVYYANYFKFFMRALQHAIGPKQLADLHAAKGVSMTIKSIDKGKYASAAALGECVRVTSTLAGTSERTVRWDQEAVAGDGRSLVRAQVEVGFVDAQNLLVPLPECLQLPLSCGDPFPLSGELVPYIGAPSIVTPTTVFSDEVGLDGRLTLEAVLRYFERNRTDIIGGAEGLKQLQEAGVMVVVARLEGAQFALDNAENVCLLGATVEARTVVEMQRRNTTVVFKQMVFHNQRLLAQAEITCVCVLQDKMKICPCPEPIIERMTKPAA